jgi:hypothetical protein
MFTNPCSRYFVDIMGCVPGDTFARRSEVAENYNYESPKLEIHCELGDELIQLSPVVDRIRIQLRSLSFKR